MTFQDSIRTCLTKYVDFSGRAGRAEYWWFFLFNFIVQVIAGILDRAIGIVIIEIIVGLALFLPGLAVLIRRLHDTNRTGWWALIILVPIVGWIVLLIFALLPSDPGTNTYGVTERGLAASS